MGRRLIGLLPTLSLAYEGMPADLQERKRAEAVAAARVLELGLGDEVLLAEPVSSVAEGEAAGRALRDADVYAVVVLPTIATMAAFPWAALDLVQAPVVVWSRTETSPEPRSTSDVVYASSPIGAAAIGNVLARSGRPFRVASGPDLSERAAAFLRGARAAGSLRGAAFAHFGGDVWPGMLDVILDRGAFEKALGGRIVDLEPDWAAGPAGLPDGVEIGEIEPEALRRSLALAGAVRAACEEAGVVAGSFHCHGDAFAGNPAVGVVCCAAVNAMTAGGVPFACTGDDCTAVALFLAQSIGDSAQYLELDAPHDGLDACLVSSGGEGDLRLARDDAPIRLAANRFFSGKAGRGAALDFALRPGPATLVGFTPVGNGFRVIALEASVIDELPPDLGVPRGYVRFPGRQASRAFEAWCEAGANHHLALAPGHHAEALRAFAEITGIEAVVP